MKHTKGPWVAVTDHPENACAHIRTTAPPEEVDFLSDVATLYHANLERRDADARLIAAAPDLLEALEALVDVTELGDGNCEEFVAAEAAIKKARGEG